MSNSVSSLAAILDGPDADEVESDSIRDHRDSLGRFTKGCKPGPGRPPGCLDFLAICRREARKADIDLEELVWATAKGLAVKAAHGDAAAGKIILDRLCGVLEKPAEVNVAVAVDARTELAVGPQMPNGGSYSDWVQKFNNVAAAQGLLGDKTPEVIEATAVEIATTEPTLEDLLG